MSDRRPYDWEREWDFGEAPLPPVVEKVGDEPSRIIELNDGQLSAARQQLIDAFNRAAKAANEEIETDAEDDRDAALALAFYKALVQGGYQGSTKIVGLRKQIDEMINP